jgi:Fe(II)/alpha-ketoglutarate-dependent arginine beta-hydroxylase
LPELERVKVSLRERALTRAIADQVLDEASLDELELDLTRLAVRAHELPERIRAKLTEFRISGRPYGGFLLSGLPVDSSALPPTPSSYTEQLLGREVDRAGVILLLLGSLIGNPFSYITQQNGRLILDVFPVGGHESTQLGSSSLATLEWHTEDAFHEWRADWLLLLCLRNPDRVPTMFATVQDLELEDDIRAILFDERFFIKPDESHTQKFNSARTGCDPRAGGSFAEIESIRRAPRGVSLFSGDPAAPFVRIDPSFMERTLGNEEAENALATLISEFNGRLQDVVLEPGDLLIIDNLRAVHGRRSFPARYDGSDRWLRRIDLTADLRKSEGRRSGPHGRALI